jgi:hypothetical protein
MGPWISSSPRDGGGIPLTAAACRLAPGSPLEGGGAFLARSGARGWHTVLAMASPRDGNLKDTGNSQANLDAHRRVLEAVNAGRVPENELASGFRMQNHVSAVTDYEYFGVSGFGDWIRDVFEVFEDGARYVAEEIIEVGEDYVAGRYSISGRGARSQSPLEFRWFGVTWFRDGRAVRGLGCGTREEVMEAIRSQRGS